MSINLVMRTTIGDVKKSEVIETRVGTPVNPAEPISLSSEIQWYAILAAGDVPGCFRETDERTTIAAKADMLTKWARDTWEKSSYGIHYNVISDEEVQKLLAGRLE